MMAIILDESSLEKMNRDPLEKVTDCVIQRGIAFWLDFGLLACIPAILVMASDRMGPDYDSFFGLMFMIYVLFACLYFPVLEGLKGWTVGKYICGIRVIDAIGYPPGFLKASVRTFLRIVEVNPFLIGGAPAIIAICISRTHQRIGDMLANTYVVKAKSVDAIKEIYRYRD